MPNRYHYRLRSVNPGEASPHFDRNGTLESVVVRAQQGHVFDVFFGDPIIATSDTVYQNLSDCESVAQDLAGLGQMPC